jgi:hypothetical protein
MKLPAQIMKRLEALERRFAPPLTVMLVVIGGKVRYRSGKILFQLEQGPDESDDAFRVRGLRAARAQFPRAGSITWIPLREEDRNL